MELNESPDVVDVEVEQINCAADYTSSIDRWYSTAQVQQILGLNKSALQKAIAKLQGIYELDIKTLRRGGARATEYSQIALDAIKLLNSQKFAELRSLVEKLSVKSTEETAIVFVERHNQITAAATTVANNNLSEIASLKSGLLNNYRQLGRVLGKQAAAEVRAGFTEEVKAGFADLQES